MVTKDDREKLSSFSLQNFKERGETMDFDYFYNREAEGFNFLKVPEILVEGEEFQGLSAEAILLYAMLLKRAGMSFKNNWLNKQNRVLSTNNVLEDWVLEKFMFFLHNNAILMV